MRHIRGHKCLCGGTPALRPQRDRTSAKALTSKDSRQGKGASEETLFDIDKGWAPNAQELAGQIQSAIEESQGSEYTSTSEADSKGEILFFTSWEDDDWDDELGDDTEQSDDEDDDDLPVEGWVDTAWSISVPEPDAPEGEVSDMGDLAELNSSADSLQTSSRQLQRELAAPDSPSASPSAVAEEVLSSMKPHEVKRIQAEQLEANENERLMTPTERKKRRKAKQRHSQLKIVSGSAAGRRLFSPAGEQVRPMMEKVRGALFSMLLTGTVGRSVFPAGARWLDLFSGTGAVGLEGLSRGCGEGHFVEMDPWVVGKCLKPNLESAGLQDRAIVHQSSVQDFLRRSLEVPSFAGGPFDYISVTPPYMMVSYTELYDLLDQSALLHERSVVIVEYAAQNKPEVRQVVGPLKLVKSRRYGRTFLALYANPGQAA